MQKLFVLIAILIAIPLSAQEFRGLEFTFVRVNSENLFDVTFHIYYKGDFEFDPPMLPVHYGDGSGLDTLEWSEKLDLGDDIYLVNYQTLHDFASISSYLIFPTEPFTCENIQNLHPSIDSLILQTTVNN